MTLEHIRPEGVHNHPGFSRIVKAHKPGTIITISGCGPADETGKCVAPGDYLAQYIKVMENLEVQMKAAGIGWADVVMKRAYVTDIDEHIAKLYTRDAPRFGDPSSPPPAATLVGVTRLIDPEFMLEIELMAVVPE